MSNELVISAEDGQDISCPVCGRPFTDDWETVSNGGDAWGGQATEACPNDCEGRIVVQY